MIAEALLDNVLAEARLAKAIAALPQRLSLGYVDYRDELTEGQCQLIVAGEKDMLMSELDEQSLEHKDHAVDEALQEALPEEAERAALRYSDEFSEFSQACYDRDDSTIYQDLVRNSGKQLVRFYIRTGKGERVAHREDSWRWSAKAVGTAARQLGRAARLDWALNREALIELVANATYGGVLCVIAYVDMRDMDRIVEHCLHGDERGRVRLTFTNPHLLAHDAWNGSGHDVRVQGDIVIRFGRGALAASCGVMALDAKGVGNGYSWDETCGPHKPAYDTGMKIHLYRAKPNQAPDKPAPESWPGR